eukprot:scaffold1708_cov322-Pavlova_lutheri.AAC.13
MGRDKGTRLVQVDRTDTFAAEDLRTIMPRSGVQSSAVSVSMALVCGVALACRKNEESRVPEI